MTDAVASPVELSVSREEWQVRKDCAALYRLVALHNWDDLTFTHISARAPGQDDHFLINRYGLFFDEITASSLVKIDVEGNVVDQSDARINRQGFLIHSTIHRARPDARFVMHLHAGPACAVAAQAQGLLPITQTAMTLLEDLAYHDYEGIDFTEEERERLVENLGPRHTMLLRNHGTLTIGTTAAAAFVRSFFLNRACDMQLRAQSGGAALRLVGPEIVANVGRESGYKGDAAHLEGLVWPGLLRKLDRLSSDFAA